MKTDAKPKLTRNHSHTWYLVYFYQPVAVLFLDPGGLTAYNSTIQQEHNMSYICLKFRFSGGHIKKVRRDKLTLTTYFISPNGSEILSF